MSIKKLGDGFYFIRVTRHIAGKKRERKFTGLLLTMGAANAKERELQAELERIKSIEEGDAKFYTWKKAFADYLIHAEKTLRLSTYYNRKTVLEKYTSAWSSKELKTISMSDVKSIVEAIPQTVSYQKEVLKYIKQVFEIAITNKHIESNPTKYIGLKDDKSLRSKASHLTAMTKTEIATLLAYMREQNHPWHDIFFVTYHLGLRSSEAVALQFSDVSYENDHVVISKSWCKQKKGFVPPKNGTSRIVPLNSQLKALLIKLQSTNGPEEFVLPRNRSWINGGATEILQKLQEHLGIQKTNYHSLRASFITHLLRGGLDITRVQVMVGHRELSTTQRYIRLSGSDLSGVTESLVT